MLSFFVPVFLCDKEYFNAGNIIPVAFSSLFKNPETLGKLSSMSSLFDDKRYGPVNQEPECCCLWCC